MKKKFSMIPLTKKMLPVLAAAVLLLPLAAHAEIKAGSVELNPFIGYNFFDSQHNIKDRPVFGGRIGYNFTENFGLEGTGEFSKTRVDDKSKTGTEQGEFSGADDVKIISYDLDVLYHFMPEERFNSFIVAGYGASHYNPEINTKNMRFLDYGVGAKYWLAENVALRADLRDKMTFDEHLHNLSATAGVVFAFGGASKAEAAPIARPVDSDKDGVLDPIDKCPNTPAGVAVDSNGCPPKKKVVVMAAAEKEKVVAAAVEPAVVVLAFEDIYFDFDQSELTPAAKSIMKEDIEILKANPNAEIRIAGYTSASGTKEYNQELSEKRAKAVRAYLVSEGLIAADRLATIGYGEADPAVYEATPKDLNSYAAEANMRVLFEIVVK